VFTVADLEAAGRLVADAWRSARDRDWTVPAGTLTWSCTDTAIHAIDTTLAPAFFLASRRTDDYPGGGWTPGDATTPDALAEQLETAARVLGGVVTSAPPDARAIIWRRPAPEVRGPADFAPRGGLELLLHGHDVCAGLGVDLRPPGDACQRLRDHVRDWPYFEPLGTWPRLGTAGDAWLDLLRVSGREVPTAV
jgi:hypothetical protein